MVWGETLPLWRATWVPAGLIMANLAWMVGKWMVLPTKSIAAATYIIHITKVHPLIDLIDQLINRPIPIYYADRRPTSTKRKSRKLNT
jgi:hypothetical protein